MFTSLRDTLRLFVRDEGVFLFCLFMPLLYPLLYAWIYNNEVVREVPVVVVDESQSALSREFISKAEASPDVRVAARAGSLDEARRMVERQQVRGIYYLPASLADDVLEGRRAFIGVYADMAVTLYYKALYQTASAVVGQMNKDIRISRRTHLTSDRDEQVAAAPLRFEEVPIFNPTGGYGNFILPAVLMLILQQTILLGIGLTAGTRRERQPSPCPSQGGVILLLRGRSLSLPLGEGRGEVVGISLAYLLVYSVWAAYLSAAVPRLFGLVMLASWQSLVALLLPYLLACTFMAQTLSGLVRYRENVMLLVVFTSVPFLFLSGVSWPLESIPTFWRGVAALLPSTFAVRAYVRLGTMGASFADVLPEVCALYIQLIAYFLLAVLAKRKS